MPFINDLSQDVLQNSKTIALVGISDKEHRDSYKVCKYLIESGFKLFPVNPMLQEVLGVKVYPTLSDIPEHIDIVDIFRKPEAVLAIVEEAIRLEAGAIWLQESVIHEESADLAKKSGLKVVMDLCIKKEHQKIQAQSAP